MLFFYIFAFLAIAMRLVKSIIEFDWESHTNSVLSTATPLAKIIVGIIQTWTILELTYTIRKAMQES